MKTKIKKAVSSLIAVWMVACFLFVPFMVSALEPVKLTVSSVKGEPGKDVVISVNVSERSGLGAAEFILKYDNTKLLYKSYQPGAAAAGGLLTVNPNYKNQDGSSALKQAFIHPDGLSAGGSIVDITFTVTTGWTGSTSVSLEVSGDFADATPPYNALAHETKKGEVTVGDAAPDITTAAGTEETAVQTDAAGETVTAQDISGDSAETTDSAAPAEKVSSQKTLAIILSVCGVLIVGAAVAFVIIKKK